MAVRWQFIEDVEHEASKWAWRVVRADETIENQSPRFASYGAAIGNAIRNGFRPRDEHWVVVTSQTVTHFRPGAKPITVSAEGDAMGRPVPAQLPKKRSAYRPSSVLRKKKPVRQ